MKNNTFSIVSAALAVVFCLQSSKALAQWNAYLELGTTASTFVGETSSDRSPIVRLAGGGGMRYQWLNGVEMDTGITYRVRGSAFEAEFEGIPIEATSQTSYVGVPLLFGYRFNRFGTWAPRVFAGPYYAFKIDSHIRYSAVGSDIEQSESDESVGSKDLGVSFGIDVNRALRTEILNLSLRGSYGLSNARTEEPKFHNMSVGLFAAIIF